MREQTHTLNPYNYYWTRWQTNGRKITKACATEIAKLDPLLRVWKLDGFEDVAHRGAQKPKYITLILIKHGYRFSCIRITDKQFGRINPKLPRYAGYKAIATTKQRNAEFITKP